MIGEIQVADRFVEVARSLGAVDLLGLFWIGFFLVAGFVRGVVWQTARLVALLGGFLAARLLGPRIAPFVGVLAPSTTTEERAYAAYIAVFVAVLLAVSLVGFLVKKAVHTLHLSLVDRLGGALVGACTGFVVHAAILVAVLFYWEPERIRTQVSRSRSLTVVARGADAAQFAFPPEFGTKLDAVFEGVPRTPPPLFPDTRPER